MDITACFYLTLTTLLIMVYFVFAGEEDCLAQYRRDGPILCFDCLSFSNIDNYCGDPFNETTKGVKTTLCNGYCVKWVRNVRPGVVRYQRTCSNNLTITMNINAVCIAESRPRTGNICFCEKAKCNAGTSLKPETHVRSLMTFLILIILLTCFR
ncbi:uncharacterized protein LOC110452748 [Mizuhopecten yessoensis]|uniref:UPAR/Ly6 domain-containing protein qvr n=1 Tax=Mizuhopecten yessoensis TaxID=6573 RepID=A0A210QIR2_MIZYE|nr:uncharacterized protein LOC110452748 [Mizuhopecten yessoensis]OWF48678.1 Protein quiver [Mizuhopecten yessoensis]